MAFEVSDMDAALAFYEGVLGMKLMFRKTDEEHHEEFAFVELDGGNLELLRSLTPSLRTSHPAPCTSHPAPCTSHSYCPHLALKTDDLDGVVRMLNEKRIAILKGPLEIQGQVRWMYLADPDNNILEFVQWL
jgi:catechol 2,3-dioxygenase-like lactoylglutathione lyase family enzyme